MDKDNKKIPKKRSGFLAIKLTSESLNYQVENYDKLTGLSSTRGKAILAFIILYILGLMIFIGQNPTISTATEYFIWIIGIIMAIIIYKWAKIGITITFIVFLLNAFFTLIADPTKILGALIAFYILAYFLYPAYQVEKNKKPKMPQQ